MIRKIFAGMAVIAAALILSGCCAKKTFTVWQLPSLADSIGNSYVIQTANGKLIVMDGGYESERNYLRGFIDALGDGKVDAWFVSHPHDDHVGALASILERPDGIVIDKIYHSRFTDELIQLEKNEAAKTQRFYSLLDAVQGIEVIDSHCGDEFEIDGINFKILTEKNPEMLTHYNDHSITIKMWDKHKSFVFLGDLGEEGGRKLMNSEYMKDVDCDYLQMAHHGQRGCDKEFYMKAKFRACLWPTPTWVYNNDLGAGFNTGHLKTVEVRDWMKEKGITEHYVSCEGLVCIR
jgi:flavorubredoxin